MPLPSILRELIEAKLVPEAIISPNVGGGSALPKVDPASKQRTAVPGVKKPYTPPTAAAPAAAGGAPGGMPSAGGPAPAEGEPDLDAPPEGEEPEGEETAEESKGRFVKHMEAAHHALALSEYHCGRLQDMKGLQEMDDQEGEQISAAHKIICDTRTKINEMYTKRSQKQ